MEAVRQFKEPKNKKEVMSFLGLVNYVSSFIPNLATETEPLRRLLLKDTVFVWGNIEKQTFYKLKNLVSSDMILVHFNPALETKLITDAGAVGLGAVLAQEQINGDIRPVYYASRSLSKQEMKYSQTEKEALAVVWATERFHLFLYGKHFKIISDHQPLRILYSHKGKPSPRVLRWGLRLQSYSFDIE